MYLPGSGIITRWNFLWDFASDLHCLTERTMKFEWASECQAAFENSMVSSHSSSSSFLRLILTNLSWTWIPVMQGRVQKSDGSEMSLPLPVGSS